MNGVFDLGGTDGLGPVVTLDNEPVFRADWEKPAFAMFASCFRAGFFGVDAFRHGIEKMDPAEYLLSNYYEHWVHTVEHYGEKAGVIDLEELERRTQHFLANPDEPLPQRSDPDLLAFVDAAVKHGADARRESEKVAQFKVGDLVHGAIQRGGVVGRGHRRTERRRLLRRVGALPRPGTLTRRPDQSEGPST
jgi:nitrile hydratase beta subunit